METFDTAKTKILSTLQEALQKGYISKDEFQAMDPSDKSTGSGSIPENISFFVEISRKYHLGILPTFRIHQTSLEKLIK